MIFEAGQTYRRDRVQDLASVPVERRDGDWNTGYTEFEGEFYIFCTVGAPARTGHDYNNHWIGEELAWEAKTGTHLGQPRMARMASGEATIHVFWRTNSDNPSFTYAGRARVLGFENHTPVRFRFGFDRAVSPEDGPRDEPVTLADLLGDDGRLFAKSEFGPADADWPALSFSSRKVASDFGRDFRRGRDFVVYIGTQDPEATERPEHRGRLLCAVTFEPNAPISTRQIVSAGAWAKAVEKWGLRWEWSFPVIEAYTFIAPLPEARVITPHTYAALGKLTALGRCVPVDPRDLAALLSTPLLATKLQLSDAVSNAVIMNPEDPDLRRALSQMAMAIEQRILDSGRERVGSHPVRQGPNLSDVLAVLGRKWRDQAGICRLCERPIRPASANRLLRPSPDRIDSTLKTYATENLHITHLGCNLAKNDASMDDWTEFLDLLRG